MAIRVDNWKMNIGVKSNGLWWDPKMYPSVPYVFNLRMDPFESYDNEDSYGHLMQKMSWLMGPMGEMMNAHLKTLADYPPVQGSKSFDMSNVVQEFINNSKQ